MARNTLASFVIACLICMMSAECAKAQFPAQGTDTIPSLGKFTIDVNSAFVAPVVSYYNAGYLSGYTLNQPTTGPQAGQTFLTSPLLFDSSTLIARSSNITQGSGALVPVGSPAYTAAGNVSASNLTLLPPGWNPATGTNEVYTAVQSLNLTGGGASVTAGQMIPTSSPNSGAVSYGEVASSSSLPTGSFPAKSFFDVFVNVNIGLTGGMSGSSIDLYNTTPLLVENNDLTSFPPKVIYTHDGSVGSPNVFINGGPNGGDLFGTIILSGHGAGYDINNPGDVSSFTQSYSQMEGALGIPEPSTWIMMLTAGVIVPAYARWGRRRA